MLVTKICLFYNVCTLNTSAKSFQQTFEHLLWARYSSEQKRQKSLPSWILHSFTYLSVSKNLHSRSDQLVFNQKGHTPKAATKSPSKTIPIILIDTPLCNRY